MHIFAGLVFLIVGMIRIKFFNDDSTSDMKAPDHIVFFSEEVLKETLEADKKVVWVIEAFTNWSKECEHVAPVFTDIAADYAPFLKLKSNFLKNAIQNARISI